MPLYYPGFRFFQPGFLKRYRFDRRIYDRAFHASLALHITHRGCLDGATCDYLVRRAKGPGAVDTIFIDPSETAEVLAKIKEVPGRARELIVSDLSFQRGQDAQIAEALGRLADNGWRISWRDHHHKQWEGANLDAIEAHARLTVDFETAECGATLVQKDLLPRDERARELAEVVRDHDLWLRKDPRSAVLADAFYHLGTRAYLDALEKTPSPEAPAFVEAAAKERKEKDRLIAVGIERARVTARGDVKVAILYGNFPTNEVLHGLQERQGVDVGIQMKPTGTFSLRSRKGMEVCHLIAGQFGGGGHPNASGGKLTVGGLGLLSYWLRREGHPEARRLVDVALEAATKHAAKAGGVRPHVGGSGASSSGGR